MNATRRFSCLGLLMACALAACRAPIQKRSKGNAGPHASSAATARTEPLPRLTYVHRTLGGKSDETLPWIVAFHGLGDTPEQFAHVFDGLAVRAHVYLPQAPIPYGAGFDWFGARVADHEGLTQGVRARLPDVAELLAMLANNPHNLGRAVVTGFSQGGILSFAVATTGFEQVKVALPIAGWLPHTLAVAPKMEVIAFHGEADTVVPFLQTKRLIENWQNKSSNRHSILFRAYPNVQHTISRVMYEDWAKALQHATATPDP